MVCLTNSKNGNKVTHTHALSVTTSSCHLPPGGRLFRILPQDKETLPALPIGNRFLYWGHS